MRTAVFAMVLVALSLAGCKSDGKEEAPKLGLTETDPTTTGSIRPTATVDVATDGPHAIEPGVLAWYHDRGVALPHGDRPAYCHGFGCEFKTTIPLDGADKALLAAIFAAHAGSAAEEREAVNLADQWWEKKADAVIGAPPDKRGSELGDAHVPGQTDCIDEATNTTSLLLWLEQNGLLRHHHVQRPESRGAFLYAHATAVMTDRETGVDWIADSWMRDSGDPIDVMTLEKWFSLAYVDPTS